MNLRTTCTAKAALATVLLAIAVASFAKPYTTLAQHSESNQHAAGINKSQAADIAKAKFGGKVLQVEELDKAGTIIFRVKLLLHGGRIKIINIKGSTGDII